jgi:hypothetical protein
MRRVAEVLAAVVMTALMSVAWLGSAVASTVPRPAVLKLHGVAGYHVTAAKGVTSMTVRTVVTVPKSDCGSGVFSEAVTTQYFVGTSEHTASVALDLGCFGPLPVYGDAVLVVGSKNKNVYHPLKPGAAVTIVVTINHSAVSVEIVYSKKSSVSLKGPGGRPATALLGAALPDPPPYSPIKFAQSTINGKALAAYKPGAYESVRGSGKVDGKPSAITVHGTAFTISY